MFVTYRSKMTKNVNFTHNTDKCNKKLNGKFLKDSTKTPIKYNYVHRDQTRRITR